MNLTLEERERRAYIEGHTEEAELLAATIDCEFDSLNEMRHERDMAQEENDRLARENDTLTTEVEGLEEKVHTLTTEVNGLKDQIHEAGIDLL
jgi:chromosome segregation ATPase